MEDNTGRADSLTRLANTQSTNEVCNLYFMTFLLMFTNINPRSRSGYNKF